MGQVTAMLGWTTWSWGMAAGPAAAGTWSAPISVMNEKGEIEVVRAIS
jgi:hypothetical protein